MQDMWMVRSGENGFLFDKFKKENLIAIGWEINDLSKIKDSKEIKKIIEKTYPSQTKSQLITSSNQVSKFLFDVKKGDIVISYNPVDRKYLIGELISDYIYNEKFFSEFKDSYNHIKKVNWFSEIERDELPDSIKNTLNSKLTVFKINEKAKINIIQMINIKNKLPNNFSKKELISKSYEEKIGWLVQEIETSPRKLKYFKYDTFLELFGMKRRRNFKSLYSIDHSLKKYKITYWNGRKEIDYLSEFKKGDTITLRMSNLEIDVRSINYVNAGTVKVASGNNNLSLYKHQTDAIKKLNEKIIDTGKNPFAGLLVLPTGGGKTLTAVYWLLRNYTDNNKKILWIAHRHELLEQAKRSFEQLAYSDILKNRSSFNYRVISGLHDKPVNIKPNDDIIISSKDSLNRGFDHLYENWIRNDNQEVFLVIDEAHHATAKTYRKLIDNVKKKVKEFRMMGLTATPFRTAEKEKGYLKKVFPDDIIYKTDLRTLINQGILSEPIFKDIKTDFDMSEVLDEKELDNIKYFDIDSIGKSTAKTIAENKKRNHCIVDHYSKNRDIYKKTLVFALNIDNAIALNSLFNSHGVKSDYVVSSIKDIATGVSVSNKLNKEKIENFRNGDTEVLVNVNILTEGTDLPEVQTIFLARPTISSILMTQMIGRGLRGKKAGGTDKAYIVNFIDSWKDNTIWVNPEKLIVEEGIIIDPPEVKEKKIARLVAISKIEEFASIMDKTIDTTQLESLDFIDRIPIGLYSFSVLKSIKGEEGDKSCEVLVYNNLKQCYDDFVNSLNYFFKINKISNKETLTEQEMMHLSEIIEKEFFYGSEKYPGYIIDDLKDILLFYAQYGEKPPFIEFKDREKYDLKLLATEIYEKDFGRQAKKQFLKEKWNQNESQWKAFFGFDEKYFINEINLILHKLEYPEHFEKKEDPDVEFEKRELEKLSMAELKECCPIEFKKLSDEVFKNAKDNEGYYHSATSNFKSKSKLKFQIDHIIPMSKGGLTVIENLQLLTRRENAYKSDK